MHLRFCDCMAAAHFSRVFYPCQHSATCFTPKYCKTNDFPQIYAASSPTFSPARNLDAETYVLKNTNVKKGHGGFQDIYDRTYFTSPNTFEDLMVTMVCHLKLSHISLSKVSNALCMCQMALFRFFFLH